MARVREKIVPFGATAPAPPAPPADLATLLDHALEERWRKYRKRLKRCQKECTEAAVHDLRVSTRRLLATLNVTHSVVPDGVPKKLPRRLKKRFKLLSPLRDAQVQLGQLEKLAPAHPGVEPFRQKLAKRERKLIRGIGKELRAAKIAKLKKLVLGVRVRVHADAVLQSDPSLASRIANAAFLEVRDCQRHMRFDDPASIHRMRIAFKKFRYTAETLRPLLPLTDAQYGEMNAYQTLMGDIQDVEVLKAGLESFVRAKKKRRRDAALREAIGALAQRREEITRAFLASVDKVNTFWTRRSVEPSASVSQEKQLTV